MTFYKYQVFHKPSLLSFSGISAPISSIFHVLLVPLLPKFFKPITVFFAQSLFIVYFSAFANNLSKINNYELVV